MCGKQYHSVLALSLTKSVVIGNGAEIYMLPVLPHGSDMHATSRKCSAHHFQFQKKRENTNISVHQYSLFTSQTDIKNSKILQFCTD